MSCYYIYRHIRLDSGRPFYIGVGKKDTNYTTEKTEYKRAYKKSKKTRVNPHWWRIVNKIGYSVEILLDNLSMEEAKLKEREFIKLYGREQFSGILCNLTDGGDGLRNYIATSETRIKQSLARKGKKLRPKTDEEKKAIGDAHRGKKLSKEHIEIIKNTHLGTKHSPQHKLNHVAARLKNCKQVVCIETSEVFSSCADVHKMFPNLDRKALACRVWRICSNKQQKPIYGFTFKYYG